MLRARRGAARRGAARRGARRRRVRGRGGPCAGAGRGARRDRQDHAAAGRLRRVRRTARADRPRARAGTRLPVRHRPPAARPGRGEAGLLDGAAGLAARVFDWTEAGPVDDVPYATMHGLYWLVASLAAREPLGAADVLAPGSTLEFAHPIVRTAVYESIPPGERALAHAEAAALLERDGAGPSASPCTCCAASPAATPGSPACCARRLRRGQLAAAPRPRPRPACAARLTSRRSPRTGRACCSSWGSRWPASETPRP